MNNIVFIVCTLEVLKLERFVQLMPMGTAADCKIE
jgi:hypothetical protein